MGQIGSEEWKKKEGDETMENVDKITENLNKVKHKVVVLSGKGGVGKSTVASNLATNINGLGKRVGLLDCDIHGPSIPKIFGIDNKKLLSTPDNRIQPFMVNKNLFVVSMGLILEKDKPVIWRGLRPKERTSRFPTERG